MKLLSLLKQAVADLSDEDIAAGVAWLQQFGYLDFASKLPTLSQIRSRIRSAQRILGVVCNGKLNAQTLKAMQTLPRCGCRDIRRAGQNLLQWQRDLATGPGVTYAFAKYTTGLSQGDQDDLMGLAFKQWSDVCGFKAVRLTGSSAVQRANIVIGASSSAAEEFGTAGNVLAWCELPPTGAYAGRIIMKFDNAERWTTAGNRGIYYLNVATHELGHGIGLDHTDVEGELMFPIYDPNVSKPQPRYDRPQGVLRYGEPTALPSGGGTADWTAQIEELRQARAAIDSVVAALQQAG